MEKEIDQKIRLLSMIDNAKVTDTILAKRDDPDWPYLMEWLRTGIISGECGADVEGDVFFGVALTSDGRSILSTLKAQKQDSSSLGFLQKYRFAIYKWVFWGIVAPVIVGLTIWYVTQ